MSHGLLGFVSIDILGLLPSSKSRSAFVEKSNRQTQRAHESYTDREITLTQVSYVSFHDWKISYGISDMIMSYDGQKFVGTLTTSLYTYIAAEALTTTTFSPQIKRQIERYNKTSVF